MLLIFTRKQCFAILTATVCWMEMTCYSFICLYEQRLACLSDNTAFNPATSNRNGCWEKCVFTWLHSAEIKDQQHLDERSVFQHAHLYAHTTREMNVMGKVGERRSQASTSWGTVHQLGHRWCISPQRQGCRSGHRASFTKPCNSGLSSTLGLNEPWEPSQTHCQTFCSYIASLISSNRCRSRILHLSAHSSSPVSAEQRAVLRARRHKVNMNADDIFLSICQCLRHFLFDLLLCSSHVQNTSGSDLASHGSDMSTLRGWGMACLLGCSVSYNKRFLPV